MRIEGFCGKGLLATIFVQAMIFSVYLLLTLSPGSTLRNWLQAYYWRVHTIYD